MSMARAQLKSDSDGLPSLPGRGALVQGRYLVTGELGRGGMGVVLSAHDEMLDRDVALKVVLPKMTRSMEIVERFSNEARSLARLESRHVVRVLDFGTISEPIPSAGLPFMVLELLRGEDLFSVAAREGGLPASRVVSYTLQACAGLAVAHSLGIVHRDLKPENLFLAIEPDGSECVKVLDFGVARSHSRRKPLTRGNVGVGSPGYMSPEQVEGSRNVDARSDIWTLGVVMYELLAHRNAFVGDTPQSLCLQILTGPVVPLAELRPDLSPSLVYIVERCMRRDPAERFQNVAELADALTPLQELSPTSDAERVRRVLEAEALPLAEPPSTPEREVVREVLSSDVITISVPGRRRPPQRRRRRAISAVAVALLFVPLLGLLPHVAQAPELAPARLWSESAFKSTQLAFNQALSRARELWMKEPGQNPAPSQPQP
jgi:eukaryotic-like serine/threonine-protein kinase